MAHLGRARLACWHRRASVLASAVVLAVNLTACGSSGTTTVTSPGTVSKCGVSVSAPGTPVPATGGTGQIAVTTARECAWTASSEAPWLSIKTGVSGQGDGAVQFEAASNPDPAVRRGAIVLNDQRAEVSQAAGECTITLGQEAASFDPSGGSGRIDVRASSALCTWTAVADADWITIRPPTNGTGTGAVTFDIAATTGPPRTARITIAGHQFSVTQSQGCAYTLDPTTYQTGSGGGTGTVAVTTTSGCTWTASSSVDWITVSGSGTSVTGSGSVSVTVAPTTGTARSATLTIAGKPFTVTQGQGCSFALSTDGTSVPAAGGNATVGVTAGAGCAWTAVSNAPWIVVASGSNGSGNGTVQLTISGTTGPNRSGTVTIAGRTFTVNQGQGCTFTITSSSGSVPAGGGPGSFDVQTAGGCAWSATADAAWLTISAGATGAGNGTVGFTAAANTGPARTGTITAAGQTFTVSQPAGCSYALSATSTSVPGDGGSGTVGVTAAAGCTWTAASNADWISVTGGSSGSGNGNVAFSAARHSGGSRSGTLTIAGLTFTINQGESCSFAVTPTQQNVAAAGGNVPVSVDTSGGCRWTAASSVAWISVPSGAGGTSDGTVQLTIAANGGGARNGTATVAGRTVTINQASGCSYSLSQTSQSAPPEGGAGSVGVTASSGCTWTAASNVPWIKVSNGASGTGNGTVQYTSDANTGAARTGTLTIAGATVTVTQASGCSYSIAPGTQTLPAAGGNGTVTVTAPAACTWTAASAVPWARVTAGASGTGGGPVTFTADPNTGPTRTGTFTIAGQTFTLTQDGDCGYAVTPDTLARGSGAMNDTLSVTAAAGCSWTAVSNVPWVKISNGAAGSGSGPVEVAFDANAGPARNGTLTVATRTVQVSQESGCTIALGAPNFAASPLGGIGSVAVTTVAGCPWTAVSQDLWIMVTAGASGSGDGTAAFLVAPNLTGAARTGTIIIGGQTFTVTQ